MTGGEAWRFQHEDWNAVAWIVLLPVAMAAHQLLGLVVADPLVYTGALAQGVSDGILRGVPYIDPNNGFATQALGRRAALEWLQGNVPWWNYFSGVGLPLAAEYQPGAFFPLTFLLLLPKGMVLMQVALQALCGIGTYGLLRQMGLPRASATVGALLYAFNGTLAWHSHAPASAVPFLPWMLWGIERAWVTSRSGPAQWTLLAGAMAWGLLCAFPETSFISSLLALAWAVVRGLQLERALRWRYAAAVTLGGLVGMAVAAPQVLAFFHYLLHADIGGHSAEFARAAFPWHALAPSIVAPYVYGPIFAYTRGNIILETVWGGIGGFVTVSLLCAAAYGFWARRDAIGWLLAGWVALTLGRTFGVEPLVTLLNLVPGVSYTAFLRYAPPSWELAIVILATRGIDDMARGERRPGPAVAAAALGIAALATCALAIAALWTYIGPIRGLRNSAIGALAWAGLTLVAVVGLVRWSSPTRTRALGALLVADAIFATVIPTLSAPRTGHPDVAAIHFLRNNLGLQRFYTLGPIQPNYGAYFAVASINHNYLPVSRRWVEFVRGNLDAHADPVVFNGNYARPAGAPSQAEELRRNLDAYQWVGVKYVVALPGEQPLAGVAGARKAYEDGVMGIFELPAPKPYYESLGGHCRIEGLDRTQVIADCSREDVLVRRELYFPGWESTVGGRPAPIAEHGRLFQSIALPAGRSEVRFSYAPPHVGWAWLAALGGLLAFAWPGLRRARRSAPRSRSAT